jgi:hypothetical protein
LAPACIRLNAIFGSDIGHFDVPDMTGVLPEAYEMVEDELVTPADFRDFTFTNVVRRHRKPALLRGDARRRRRGCGVAGGLGAGGGGVENGAGAARIGKIRTAFGLAARTAIFRL